MIDMNKKQILEVLKKYNFDKNKYIVISGAAMVLLGIKESTSDIDIAVKEEYMEYLLNNYNCTFEKINVYNKQVYFIDDIINFSTSYYSEDNILVDNIPIQKTEDLLKLKLYLNREKDKKDIKLLREFINE